MAAFSYHAHLPFGALDPSSYLPNPAHFDLPLPPPPVPLPPLHHHQAGDLTGAAPSASWLPCYYPVGTPTLSARTGAPAPTHVAAAAAESSSSLSSGGRTVPSGDHCRVASSSSSSAQLSEVASRAPSPMEKKRKERQQWSSGSAHPDYAKEAGSMKQRRRSAAAREAAEVKKKAIQEAPSGYIHVRARRGQATDSHSLAERARREKISERMKMLQGLVPGCDKVVGKALMLDEIINYVQSLQHQVEFLSMKLASVNPMLYESSFDLEFMNGYGTETDQVCGMKLQKLEGTSPAPLSVQPASHIQSTAFVETTNNCPVQDTSVSYLLHGQGPNAFPQDNGSSFVMQLGDTRQTFLNQENMCSFQ